MPACYTHYRFGFRAFPKFDPSIAAIIRQNRHLYDLGLHGPDFFFYYNPFRHNRFAQIGKQLHQTTGREFFSRAIRNLKLNPDDGSQAYLWGMLCHFVLDAHCHPFVNEKASQGIAGHLEMETEFDRFLLELDRKPLPHEQDIFRHVTLHSREDAGRIARFYPKTTPAQIQTCYRNMQFLGRLHTAPEGIRRNFIGAGLAGNVANESMMMLRANPRCKDLTPELFLRYTRAEKALPEFARQLQNHLLRAEPLGKEFDAIFG